MMTFSNGPMSSAQKGATQPPKRKPPVGSSSGPPGACITPSSETKTAPVSLRIGGLAGGSGLERGDVDLLHLHHRVEDALAARRVAVHRLGKDARGDLPRHPPLVLAPAAHRFLPAVVDDRVPVA